MLTSLMARLTRLLTAFAVSIGLLLTTGAANAPAAFAASPPSTATIADTPTHGVSSTNMRGSGAMVLYPAHVYATVPFLVMVSAPTTDLRTAVRIDGGTHTTVAVQYIAAQGARHLDWRQIQRSLVAADHAGSVMIDAAPAGMHIEYVWLSWWVTLPQVGQHTLRVDYVSSARQYTSQADIDITAVRAQQHGALVVDYPYAPTYRVWPHAPRSALPQHLTIVASATSPGATPMIESYDATMSRPSTLSLPLPAAVALQASTLGVRGTVTDLLYEQTPHPYAPAMASYTALVPTVRLLPPGQPADGGMWGWLTKIL